MANTNEGCTTPVADENYSQSDQYALFVIVYISMTLNLMFLLLLVIKLIWTALQTCQVIHMTSAITSTQQQISIL